MKTIQKQSESLDTILETFECVENWHLDNSQGLVVLSIEPLDSIDKGEPLDHETLALVEELFGRATFDGLAEPISWP